jgi:hypothetical protein
VTEVLTPNWTRVSPEYGYHNLSLKANESVTDLNFTNEELPGCISGYKLADYQWSSCVGLTPGYWKNWRNHYNDSEFKQLLEGTIAGNITIADNIFANYNASPGYELTILKAHLLATQLTLHLTDSDLPNPDDAYLTGECTIEWEGNMVTVGAVVDNALNISNNSTAYERDEILEVKDQLDTINNLAGYEFNEGKVGLAGWNITVTNSADDEWTTTTNETGYWQVCGLALGNYTVCEVPNASWIAVEPADGCLENVSLGANEAVTNMNFTNRPLTAVSPAIS